MKRFLLAAGILTLGCAPAEKPAEQPPPPAPINLADIAGEWAFGARDAVTDSTLLFYKIMATADTSGWMIELPGRKPMPMKVMASGDSLMTDVGPYESVLRKGVQVSSHSVLRFADGRLAGMVMSTYKTAAGDSVARFNTDGTKTKAP